MIPLSHQRCLHHAHREAVARCPECKRFFCRECVAEHDDRILCAGCLAQAGRTKTAGPSRFSHVLHAVQTVLACVLIWFFFYLIGVALLAIPSSFHDGTIWKSPTLDGE